MTRIRRKRVDIPIRASGNKKPLYQCTGCRQPNESAVNPTFEFQGKLWVYRIIDERLISSNVSKDFFNCFSFLLEEEEKTFGFKFIWIVGHLSEKSQYTKVFDTLKKKDVTWLQCNHVEDYRFSEDGLYIPSKQVLSIVDKHADSTAEWLMICPWYCVMNDYTYQNIFEDFARQDYGKRLEVLLRDDIENLRKYNEADLKWARQLFAIFPRDFNSKKDSIWLWNEVHRTGWTLNAESIMSKFKEHSAPVKIINYRNSAPSFNFGICLRSRACSHDWSLTCQNLERTFYNLSRQRCMDFRIWVAVHEIPEVKTFGLDIEFIVVDFKPPVRRDGTFGNDKRRKRNSIGNAMSKKIKQGFYYMQLDADDLVDISLVQCVYEDDNRAGYLIGNGYVFDYLHGIAAKCNEQTTPFWKQCGSCAVLYFEPEDLVRNNGEESYFESQRFHENFAELSRKKGRDLKCWNDDMALYLVNHGENDWANYRYSKHERRANSKSNFVRRHCLESTADKHLLRLRYPELKNRMLK